MRALKAMGIDPAVVHLNEGHAAFASLELARGELAAGASLDDALAAARARTVFTTHTPVPAGNDTYETELVCDSLRTLAGEVGVDLDTIVRLGRTRPDDDGEPFGVTQFALHTSRSGNGVSRRHGEVAREMWAALWPDRAVDDVPIGYVTNGVHLPDLGRRSDARRCSTAISARAGWTAPRTRPRGRRSTTSPTPSCGPRAASSARALVTWARERSMVDRLGRDEPREYVEAPDFDPDVLTIGFARRLATYKRLHVLLQSAERIVDLLSRRAPDPDPHGRQGAPARRRRQAQPAGACSRPRASPRSAAASPTSTTTTSRIGARLVTRLRRVGQPPAPAAGGQRHERDEVGGQRRPAAQRPRRLVGRGLRRQQRLGAARARSTTTTARRTPATPPSSCACSTTRSSPPSTTATSAACRPRGSKMMRASLRTNGPEFSATRMLRDYAERIYA